MKPCQLCGECSWGPLPNPFSWAMDDRRWLYISGKDPTLFRQCDNCGTLAQDSHLQDDKAPSTSTPGLAEMLGAEPIAAGMSFVKGLFPAASPPTRLERLVATMVRSCQVDSISRPIEFAKGVVFLARCIERELDVPQKSELQAPPWVNLTFQDRDACKTWVLSVLDSALEKMEPVPMRMDLHPYRRDQFLDVLAESFVWMLETHVVLTEPSHGE